MAGRLVVRKYLRQAVGTCDLRSLSARVFFPVESFNPDNRFVPKYREPYLTFVHETAHLVHLIATPAGLRIHLLLLASLTYALRLIAQISQITGGNIQAPACAPDYLTQLSKTYESFESLDRQQNTQLEHLYWNLQTLSAQFGTVDLPLLTSSNPLEPIEIISLELIKRTAFADDRIAAFPHAMIRRKDGAHVPIFAGTLMVIENLAKFIELEHLREM